jgi:hypothetical protein
MGGRTGLPEARAKLVSVVTAHLNFVAVGHSRDILAAGHCMNFSNERNPYDRLFVNTAKQISVYAFFDFLHRHIHHRSAFSSSHKYEPILGFKRGDVRHIDYNELLATSNEDPFEFALPSRLIEVRALRGKLDSIHTRNALRQPFAADWFDQIVDGVNLERANRVMLERRS